ncbi:uncharacterized protein [Amphiura filiformis]|uniref:uncharacterized protein n=1 Tax=Amphiura filiformis TaxID=82378 RepID=UPI003B21DD00
MQKTISVTIPTALSPRPAVARQSMQNALNRSVPALSQDEKPEHFLYKTTPAPARHSVRAIKTGTSSATNEFCPRTRGGQSRLPAKTKVVDVGDIFVHPTERLNVRGVQGFFPPLRIKGDGGSMRTRVSMSAPPGLGPNYNQEARKRSTTHTNSKSLNVELAPASAANRSSTSSSRDDKTNSPRNKEAWPTSPHDKKTNESPVRFQDNEAFDPAVPRREPVSDMRVTSENGHVTSLNSPSRNGFSTNKDTPFIRAFKLKQKRQNKFKEIMDSNYRSPTTADFRQIQTP